MTRRLVPGLVICAVLSGCKLSANYGDTRYRCDESGECPDGFSCMQGWCEADPLGPDGGPLVVPEGCGTMGIPYNDFDSETINTRRWGYSDDGSLTVTQAGGQLVFTVPEGESYVSAQFYTNAYYRMQGGSAFVEVPPLATDSDTSLTFMLGTHGDEQWFMSHYNGALRMMRTDLRGDELELASVTYDPEKHRFWRFREHDGVLYWETSADGQDYSAQASNPVNAAEVLVRLRLSIWTDEDHLDDRVLVVENINGGVASDLVWCPVEVLSDDFDDGQIALVWNDWDTGSGEVFEQGGQLVFVYAEPGAGDSGFYSLTRYDMTQGALVVEGPRSDPGEMMMFVNLDFPHNGDDALFVIHDGVLRGEKEVAGSTATVFSEPFDPEQHRWLRLRGDGGTVYWETSPDRREWQMYGVHSEPPFDLTEVAIEIGSESDGGAIDNIGNGFDNLNIAP